MNGSIMPYFDEIDEIKQKIIISMNKAGSKIPGERQPPKIKTEPPINKKEPKIDKDIEKLIWDSIDIINKDEICFEPKMTPFIPGIDQNLLLINE